MAKVLSIQSRREMSQTYNSLCYGSQGPEVYMHPDDYELYNEECKTNEFYRGVPHFKGSPVKMGGRFKPVKGRVIFALDPNYDDSLIEFVEAEDLDEQLAHNFILSSIQEAFDRFTPERKHKLIALLEKKVEELRKTFLN